MGEIEKLTLSTVQAVLQGAKPCRRFYTINTKRGLTMTAERKKSIIRVRKGINGFKYSACDSNGNFLGNFEKLADVRKHWLNEIKWGQVALVRELDKMPDMSKIEATKETIEKILKAYARKGKR